MDTFLCKYRNVDQAHTKFMIVTLFRERERKNGARKRMMEEFILNLLFLKKTKVYYIEFCTHGFDMLFSVIFIFV